MAGLTNLHEILGALRPSVRTGRFVVVSSPTPPTWTPRRASSRRRSTTLILTQDAADAAGLPYDAVFGWITLQVHSSLESVGITSAVSTALARVGISCNVLAGFYHDHLLVPVDDVDEAVDVLGGLS